MKLFGGGKPASSGKHDGDKAAGQHDEAGYFDSPTENVSLSAPTPQPSVIVSHVEEPPPVPSFGINSTIQLMRSLPLDQNAELVVTVIKTTLESMRVKVTDIIADAAHKLGDLERRVETLSKEIADYEREIAQRKEQIAALESDHRETADVKGRLELAEQATNGPKRVQAHT
jgi:hypothetical protein